MMKNEVTEGQESLLSYICNLTKILDSNLVSGRSLTQEERIRLRSLLMDSKESYKEKFNVEPNYNRNEKRDGTKQRSLLSEYSSVRTGRAVSPLERRILQKAGKLGHKVLCHH